jgi:HSP20 family protein
MQSLAGLMTSRFIPFFGEDRFIPAMDVATRGDDLVIRVEIPAVDVEKDVDITVDQGTLRITGKRQEELTEDREGFYLREMRYGSFQRTFPLPDGIEPGTITAEYRDGILEVSVPGGAKQVTAPEAQHIRITRGAEAQPGNTEGGRPSDQKNAGQGGAPESWAPADHGTSSAAGSSEMGSEQQRQMTPD